MNDELNRRAPAQPEPAAPRNMLTEARDAIRGLLSKIRRDAPQLSGKTMGWAEQVANDIDAALAAAPTVVEPEPVGKRMTVEELARTDGRFPFVWWREVPPGSLLYLAAPPRTPLTDAEIRKIAVEQASSSFGPADNDDETIDWIFNREDLLIFARAVIAASEGERK